MVDLVGFENEEFIFPAVHHAFKFCKITIAGEGALVNASRIAFYIRKFSQLSDDFRFFTLNTDDFALLNPNTGNCPIFRSQADAELTKAIYRRVPILWREATEEVAESNPWRLSFNRLFDMSNDSHHFRTANELGADGYRLEGNVFISPYDRYLPLYEAKMVHQFDHRFSTYEGATEKQLNVGILPQATSEQKRNPAFVVQPRYWVREEVVESAVPKYPEPLALALRAEHRPSIQRILCYWMAGHQLNHGQTRAAEKLLDAAAKFEIVNTVTRALGDGSPEELSSSLEHDFPLAAADISAIEDAMQAPESLARDLLERFSPKWFLGWRDICRSTDARTLIASALPVTPVGHKFQLIFSRVLPSFRICLEAILDSFVLDYVARQKLGGTSFSYFIIRQLPVPQPQSLAEATPWTQTESLFEWLSMRMLELIYTAQELSPLARDCGYDGPPFPWDEDRRFEIRCELDAAFFNLYLGADPKGEWPTADGETPEQLAALKKHFPTPRDAVAFILDQFPLVRQKDEAAHGRYRTKDRILEIYDEMLSAKRSGQAFQTALNPPPGGGPR